MKTTKKKAYARRRAPVRRRKMRGSNGVPEWASASFTRSLINPVDQTTILNPNVTYRLYDTAIDSFPRAIPIASAYQQYRIKRITLKFRPLVDTFTAGAAQTVPQLYYMVDKIRALSGLVGLASLKSMGAVARRLDDKTLSVSWAPGVLDAATDNIAGAITMAKANISPWLNTTDNPFAVPAAVSSVDHLGLVWNVEQLVGNSGNFTIDCTIDVQFKKPAFEPADHAGVGLRMDVL